MDFTCGSIEDAAERNSLAARDASADHTHSACHSAIATLDCAIAFSRFQCGGEPQYGKPCISVCRKIVSDCKNAARESDLANTWDVEEMCTLERGFGEDASCAEIPRENQLMVAAANGLSPLAVNYAELWQDETKFDDHFLHVAHAQARAAAKGQSFIASGPRWFGSYFFEDATSLVQDQFSQAQASEHVLRERVIKRRHTKAVEASGDVAPGEGDANIDRLVQLEFESAAATMQTDEPLFGWMEVGTIVVVAVAYHFQRKLNNLELEDSEDES
jgi:hypothetical protein